ncbi:hypothetical protein [Lachnoanaerobaculum saburreum]|uniref:Uncharacterized protein n=1 Tax=Lachnoanaerobaculum saburreum TaxID=467210 RepID=A0A133ZXQ9_9FIRM|nr:hypothetical protein [Lachnoanaerobaculum saburreum]KXB60228.1 hypothetical protein HMPREF1866_00654 [Lachnoanaerobaculum saburreum]
MWKEQKYDETKEVIPKDHIMLSGIVYIPDHFDKERKVDKPVAREDGKDVCKKLRDYRKQLAAMNNIEFISEECGHVGPCAGTCDKCDEESKYLSDELSKIPEEKQRIPRFEL